MPEGVSVGGQVIGEGVYNDPAREPDPDPVAAPKGWTWNKTTRRWTARKYNRAGASPPPPEPEPDDDREGKDPEPGWMRDEPKAAGSKKRHSAADVPKAVRDDLAGALGFMGMVVLPVAQSIDPHCGGAFAANYQQIAEACIPLMCRSERVIKFMTSTGGGFMDYVALALALAPVAKAIGEHHVFHVVEVVRDPQTGVKHVIPRNPGGSEHGDHLTPDFNSYAA